MNRIIGSGTQWHLETDAAHIPGIYIISRSIQHCRTLRQLCLIQGTTRISLHTEMKDVRGQCALSRGEALWVERAWCVWSGQKSQESRWEQCQGFSQDCSEEQIWSVLVSPGSLLCTLPNFSQRNERDGSLLLSVQKIGLWFCCKFYDPVVNQVSQALEVRPSLEFALPC